MKNASSDLFASANAPAIRSEINVTPLVDVCLVLLIIFMVVTPMLQEGVAVDLPENLQPEQMPEGANQLTLTLKVDGSCFVGEAAVPRDQLAAALQTERRQHGERQVVVKAHRALKYSEVREVLRQLSEAGFAKVGLVTVKRQA